MRPLRFGFVTTFYPPYNFGGDGIGIQRLARGLVRAGHRVTVIHDADAFRVLGEGPEPEPEAEVEGLEVVTLDSGPFAALSVLLTHQVGRPVMHRRAMRRLLNDERFDVVNFHNISLAGGPAVLSYGGDALRLYMAHEHWLVCPTHVLWRHGRELCTGRQCVRCVLSHRRPPQLYRYTGFMSRQLEKVDTFIAMSEFSREKHRDFGFPYPMEVLPPFLPEASHGSSPEADGSPHPRPYFLFVGRLERIKGLQDVIPVFRDYQEADLLIAGSGDYEKELQASAEGLERVHFLGHLPSGRLDELYRGALALVVPSVCFETFGINLIEAFRQGTPVIARNLGPFPEIVRGSGGGELFEDREGLVGAMRRIQQDERHRRTLSESGARAFRDIWTEEAVISRYLDIVRRTAERRGRGDIVSALQAVEV